MLICKRGNFSLRHSVYVDNREVDYKDINLCKELKDGSNYVIASFDKEGQIVSCGNRLFEEVCSEEDLSDVKKLNYIANLIIKAN